MVAAFLDTNIPRNKSHEGIERQVTDGNFERRTAQRLAKGLLCAKSDSVNALVVGRRRNAHENQHQRQSHGGLE